MSAGKILAYLDRWSVHPGQTLQCRVSCENAETFDAELVRVIQGDTHPQAPPVRMDKIPIDLGGPFKARYQALVPGSYAVVDDNTQFAALTSFAISVRIWPTTPQKGAQTIIARRDPTTGYGFELYIDETASIAAEVACAQASVRIKMPCTVNAKRWYRLILSYDAVSGTLSLEQRPKIDIAKSGDRAFVQQRVPAGLQPGNIRAPVTVAARRRDELLERRLFNGRIENPKIFESPIHADSRGREPPSASVLANWDFSLDIPSTRVMDTGPHRLHGTLVNLPTRGVTGYSWDGTTQRWSHADSHYGAIHFHDDDLYDAGWDEDFQVVVPQDLASGVYALRLYTDEAEFYTPFAVRARLASTSNKIAFLLPTASYMAYANNRIGLDVPETELVCGRLIELTQHDLYMQTHPQLGLSFYDLHSDGSGVYYSSRLRPIMDMQPKFIGKLGGVGSNVWQFNADTHILGWLEHIGAQYDVLTDEDLHDEGVSSIENYQVVITGTHPEYYSSAMRGALTEYCEGEGRLMYLGGNGFYWRIAFHPELPGVIECRKSEDGIRAFAPQPGEFYASFTGEYTGLWRRNGKPPNDLVGVGMVAQGFDVSSPYVRTQASADPRVEFVFDGIDDTVIGDFGLSGGGAAGMEVDAANVDLNTPPHALVVASSQIHSDLYLVTPEDMLDPVPGLGGLEVESIRADMVFFETAGNGAVFSVGSIAWGGAMAWNNYDNTVAKLTQNVLRRFCDKTPF